MKYEARSLAECGEEGKECWKFEASGEGVNNYLRGWENKFPREISCLAVLSSVLRPSIVSLKPVQLAWLCHFPQQHKLL